MLCGMFVLYTGIAWEFLPREMGFGSEMTCWRRLEIRDDIHEAFMALAAAITCCDVSSADLLVGTSKPGAFLCRRRWPAMGGVTTSPGRRVLDLPLHVTSTRNVADR